MKKLSKNRRVGGWKRTWLDFVFRHTKDELVTAQTEMHLLTVSTGASPNLLYTY